MRRKGNDRSYSAWSTVVLRPRRVSGTERSRCTHTRARAHGGGEEKRKRREEKRRWKMEERAIMRAPSIRNYADVAPHRNRWFELARSIKRTSVEGEANMRARPGKIDGESLVLIADRTDWSKRRYRKRVHYPHCRVATTRWSWDRVVVQPCWFFAPPFRNCQQNGIFWNVEEEGGGEFRLEFNKNIIIGLIRPDIGKNCFNP